MSALTDAMIINGVVLVAVLEGDLGPHRTIGRFRILRPLITVALVVPLFLDRPVIHGNGRWLWPPARRSPTAPCTGSPPS